MPNPNYNADDMNPAYPAMGMDEGQGMQGDDVEIDNRIKELLLSTHNLYLIGQMHEKEIREPGGKTRPTQSLTSCVRRTQFAPFCVGAVFGADNTGRLRHDRNKTINEQEDRVL
ncbi:MAG: hypothetical protein PHC90_14605 [Syntrophorhabdaceae bacterium]|nr:hypothetical protein [Syntrophorhabdaceae bacterium]